MKLKELNQSSSYRSVRINAGTSLYIIFGDEVNQMCVGQHNTVMGFFMSLIHMRTRGRLSGEPWC